MVNDTNKKTCERCNKKDCAQCVEEDGKSFCCQTCCGEYKKEKEEKSVKGGSASPASPSEAGRAGGKEESANICRFC